MKDFDYYKAEILSKYSIRKQVYEKYNFNPDLIDSKSEEKRVREELEVEIEKIYKETNEKAQNKFEEFKNDLFEDLDIANNPKREKLFDVAWEKGHSYGYEGVYVEACELVELIKD